MKQLVKKFRTKVSILLILSMALGIYGNVKMVNAGETYKKHINCTYEFSFIMSNLGIPGHKRMQNIEIVGNNVYATFRYNADKDNKKDDLAILKFKLDKENKQAEYTGEKMVIIDGGHGEALDTYKYTKGKTSIRYFIIGVKAYDDSTKKKNGDIDNHGDQFATQIAFIRFKPGTSIKYSDCSRISHLNYLGKANSSRGTVVRAVASISGSDINIRTKYSNKNYYYATYNVKNIIEKKIYKSVSSDQGKSVSASDLKGTTYFKSGTAAGKCTGHASFQGMESQGAYVYISSGHNQAPRIGKYSESNMKFNMGLNLSKTFNKVQIKNPINKVTEISVNVSDCETQGLCMDGGKVYMLIEKTYKYDNDGKKEDSTGNMVISVPKF